MLTSGSFIPKIFCFSLFLFLFLRRDFYLLTEECEIILSPGLSENIILLSSQVKGSLTEDRILGPKPLLSESRRHFTLALGI